MVEIGVEVPKAIQSVPDYAPTDIIELNKDAYQPSATYSKFSAAVQKDMTLGFLTETDIRHIELRLANCQDIARLLAKDKKYGYLQNTANDYLAWIAARVTTGRGRAGATAKLMRSSYNTQTVRELEGNEKRREAGMHGKARQAMGL